jgi:rod shape determining protein RodA
VLERPWYVSFNYRLAAAAIALSAFGLVAIRSATLHAPDARGDFAHQVAYLVVGAIAMGAMAFIDYHVWYRFSKPIYIIALVMLAAVRLAGHEALGAQRWIGVGPLVFQPSEPAKLLVVLSVAAILANPKRTLKKWTDLVLPIAAVAAPALLVLMQPDLGTALVLIVILTAMLFFALPNLAQFGAYVVGMVTLGAGAVLSPFFLKGYQRQRLLVFLDPKHDPQGSGWSLIQSKIAVGSGELFGKGLYNGTQTQLGFVPEHATDFIFTVIGEEFGFVGSAVLLGLYALLLGMGMLAVNAARDKFGLLVAVGIVAMFAFQVLVNIGMTIGIMPITGIPLPFISYGGSSLVTCLASVGVLLNIHLQRTRMTFD